MNDDMPIGNNAATLIRDTVDRLVELAQDDIALREDIKEFRKELGQKKFPVKQLIALAEDQKAPADKRQKALDASNAARALLGLPAIAEGAVDGTPAEADKKLCKERIEQILALKKSIKDNAETRKEVLAEAKDAGLVPKVLMKIVTFRIDPEKYESFKTGYSLVDSYADAYDSVSQSDREDQAED